MTDFLALERILTSLLWGAIIINFAKPAYRMMMIAPDLKSHEPMMAATWVLAINRLTFTGVSQFLPDVEAALALCYGFAFFGAILMVFCGSWARRINR